MPTKIGNAKLYSVPEVSQAFNVTTVTIRNYIKKGYLKAQKLIGRWMITEEELKKFVNEFENNCYKRSGEMGEDWEKEIKEIMAGMECPRDFACCALDRKPSCEVKDVELENHLEITGVCNHFCKYLVVSRGVGYCKCPLCVYLTKKIGHWDLFPGTKRFAIQKIFSSQQEQKTKGE
jgi:polyhydroxyalkanoate synthesis regulator phasin